MRTYDQKKMFLSVSRPQLLPIFILTIDDRQEVTDNKKRKLKCTQFGITQNKVYFLA